MKILVSLGIALLIGGFVVGNTNVTMDTGHGITCGEAFGGIPSVDDLSVAAVCAPIRADQLIAAQVLMFAAAGLLVSAFVMKLGTPPARVPIVNNTFRPSAPRPPTTSPSSSVEPSGGVFPTERMMVQAPPTPTDTPPGWYPNPYDDGREGQIYWDGIEWQRDRWRL